MLLKEIGSFLRAQHNIDLMQKVDGAIGAMHSHFQGLLRDLDKDKWSRRHHLREGKRRLAAQAQTNQLVLPPLCLWLALDVEVGGKEQLQAIGNIAPQ